MSLICKLPSKYTAPPSPSPLILPVGPRRLFLLKISALLPITFALLSALTLNSGDGFSGEYRSPAMWSSLKASMTERNKGDANLVFLHPCASSLLNAGLAVREAPGSRTPWSLWLNHWQEYFWTGKGAGKQQHFTICRDYREICVC